MSSYLDAPLLTPRERSRKFIEGAFAARDNARTDRRRARECPEDASQYEALARDAFGRSYWYLHQARVLRIIANRSNPHA